MRTHTRGAPTVFFITLLWPLLLPRGAAAAATAGGEEEEVDPSGGIPFMGGNYDGQHPMLYFGPADVEVRGCM